MDLYNIFTKIPYIIMLGIGLTLVLQIYVGSLQNISHDIDEGSKAVYDMAIATEQVQNLGERRSFIDLDYIGVGADYDCQITEIEGLDDEYLTYRTQSDSQIDCAGVAPNVQDLVQSRLILVDGNGYPTTIEVYEN